MLEGSATIQKDQDKLEKWPGSNQLKLSKGKCKALHLEWNNTMQQYRLSCKWVESSFTEKDLQVLVETKLKMTSGDNEGQPNAGMYQQE